MFGSGSARTSLLIKASLICSLHATPLCAIHNASGWIESDAWNFLSPLLQDDGCSGGGRGSMLENWLYPYEIGLEDPHHGDVWEIDFDSSPATGSAAAESLWFRYGSQSNPVPHGPTVDLRGWVLGRNSQVAGIDEGLLLPTDNLLLAATTYVENTSPFPREIEIVTSSDDSIQVWLNNQLVTNVSACRPLNLDGSEAEPAYLPPGVSKISVLCWQGVYDWSFRLGIRENGILLRDGDDSGILFRGPGQAEEFLVGQRRYELERSAEDFFAGCLSDEYEVLLDGESQGGQPEPEAELTIVEEIRGRRPLALEVEDVTHGGTVETIDATGFASDRFISSWLLLGPLAQEFGPAPDPEILFRDFITDGLQSEIDIVPVARDTIEVDFGGAAASTGLASGRDVNLDGVPTWELWQDPDDTIDFEEYYGGDVDNAVMYAVTYLDVAEDVFVDIGVASDDSILVMIGDVIVLYNSVARGCGLPLEIQDTVFAVFLARGRHRLMVKVFEGNVDHCFRLGMWEAGTGESITSRISICTNPEAAPGECNEAGKRIVWQLPRHEMDDGVRYTLRADAATKSKHRGLVLGEVYAHGPDELIFDRRPELNAGPFEMSQDIGVPPTPGSTSFDGVSEYTMTASGYDIWEAGDQFRFAYTEVSGDFIVEARVTERIPPASGSRWGKHGLMARWSCDPDAKFSLIQTNLASPGEVIDTPRHSMRLRHGFAAPVIDTHFVDDFILPDAQPEWMRLMRIENTIYSFLADDTGGEPDWILVGSDSDVNMPDSLFVGMALTSHAGFESATIRFDNVRILPLEQPEPRSPCTDVRAIVSEDFSTPEGGDPQNSVVVQTTGTRPRVTSGRLRLASEGDLDVSGAVWFPPPPPADQLLHGFRAEFRVFASRTAAPYDPASGPADGLTFAVVDAGDNAYGTFPPDLDLPTLSGGSGGGLGYGYGTLLQRTEGHGSFSVEFDLWQNTGDMEHEPPGLYSPIADSGWHIAVNQNGYPQSSHTNVDSGILSADLPDIYSPSGISVVMRYEPTQELDGKQAILRVSVSPGERLGFQEVINTRIRRLSANMVPGFTVATGSQSATLEIDEFRIYPIYCCSSSELDVLIEGPLTIEAGTPARYSCVAIGDLGPDGQASYQWDIVSGSGTFVETAGNAVELICSSDLVISSTVTSDCSSGYAEYTIRCLSPPDSFRRPGDCNSDGRIDISDALCLFGFLFLGDPLQLPCDSHQSGALYDWNGDFDVDMSDGVYALHQLFLGGPVHSLGRNCLPVRGCANSPNCP